MLHVLQLVTHRHRAVAVDVREWAEIRGDGQLRPHSPSLHYVKRSLCDHFKESLRNMNNSLN